MPGASDRAAIAAAVKVAAGGSSNINLLALDLSASNATALFDFASSAYGVRLGNAISNWDGGLAEFRTGYGLYGNGTGNTTLNVGTGTELLFSTVSGTRNLYNLTVNNSGTIHATSGILSISYTNVTNQSGGLIHADGAEIDFGSYASLTNLGTIRATGSNGSVVFANTLTTAGLGSVDLVGGAHAYLTGTLDNTGATLNAPTGGTLELHGGTISGGTIAAGAISFSTSGGYLSGATLAGDLTLPQSTSVRLTNGTTFAGGNIVLGNYTTITWQQSGTLRNQAVSFAPGAWIYLSGANRSLTFDAATTLTGRVDVETDGSLGTTIVNQGTINHTYSGATGTLAAASFTNSGTITNSAANTGLVIGSTYNTYNTYNTGTITVNATGATIYLDGNVDLTGGTVNATNGSVQFRGNNTTAHLNGGTLQIASGAHAYLNGTLDNSGTTLSAPASGIYELYGGTITGGSIGAGALTFTNSGGYLDGVTVNGDLTLPTYANVKLLNGSAFSGSNLTLGNSSTVFWQQASTLSNKTVTFGNGAWIYLTGGNRTLTLDSGTTATGRLDIETDGDAHTSVTNQGTLTHTASGSSGYLSAPTLTNSGTIANTATNATLAIGSTSSGYTTVNTGTITVNASGASIYLDGNVDLTGGTVNATNGTIQFRGSNTTAHLNGGTLQVASGAHAYLNGTLNNSGATLNAPTSGTYELYGGTISGGSIAPGALTFTSYGGILDAALVNDDLTVGANGLVRFRNGATFAGANATLGNSSGLYWDQSGTLTGKNLSFGSGSYVYLVGANRTLTLDASTSATGQVQIYSDGSSGSTLSLQGSINHTATNTGYLYAETLNNSGTITNTSTNGTLYIGSNSTGYVTRNTGTIAVNGTNAAIYLDGSVDSTGGTLTATNGELVLSGNNTTAHLNGATVNIGASGHVYLNGTLDNSAATLAAPASGIYELYGGTVNNGSIAAGALTFSPYAGTLNGVTILGNLTVPNNAYAYWTGGTNLGSAHAAVTLGSNSGVYWKQSGTLTDATLTFGNGAYLYLTTANAGLTLDAATTATGDVSVYSDASTGTTLTNQGTITHTTGNGYLFAETFTNTGTIGVTGGTLYLGTNNAGSSVANNAGATIRINGGALSLQPPSTTPLVNHGLIDLQSGTLYTNGRLVNGSSGTFSGAGTISGNLIVSGGAISPGNSGIGTLTFNSGTLTVSGAATFAVDLGATTSDKLVFQYPGANIDLGSGLLTLSLNLLAAPTPNTTFNLITLTSGTYAINGTFAGLPNSGDTLTANFGGTAFTFSINYQPNFVSLAYNPVVVPEPSTVALLLLGGVIGLAAARRRRRAA